MQTIKLNTRIDAQGNIHLPDDYQNFYGKEARLALCLQDKAPGEPIDPMQLDDDSETGAIARLSEPALKQIWNNEDDAIYDQ